VNVTYYPRLEQGQSHQASPSVIEALADALRLSDAERAYLHTLVRPEVPRTFRTAAQLRLGNPERETVATAP
jgi:hypothetical protein